MRVMIAKCPHCGRPVEATTEKLHEPVDCPHCSRPFEMEVPKVRVAEVREVAEEAERSPRMVEETSEQVLIETHPAMFRAHPLRFLGVLLLLALAGFGVYSGATSAHPLLLWGAAACLAVLLVLLLVWWLEVRATTLTVTDSRTILRKGLFSRATSEVEHDDIRNIQMDQSFLERLLRVGDIGISSSGQDDLEVIARAIPHPNTVVQTIRDNQS
jgi:DNA-directed RNA polymerase subunit RPC12/RpoP